MRSRKPYPLSAPSAARVPMAAASVANAPWPRRRRAHARDRWNWVRSRAVRSSLQASSAPLPAVKGRLPLVRRHEAEEMTGSVGWSRGASARCTAFLSVSERVDREVVGAVVEVETALARLGTFRICTCSASSTQSQPRSRQMFDLVRCDEVHSAACKHRAHIPPPSRATGQRTHDILPSDDTPTLLAADVQGSSDRRDWSWSKPRIDRRRGSA